MIGKYIRALSSIKMKKNIVLSSVTFDEGFFNYNYFI